MELRIEGTLLEDEWRAIESAVPEEREFCAAAAALGLDPYALEDERRNEIASIGDGGLVGLNHKESPGFVLSPRRDEARRFHLCRAFFEYLIDPTLDAALLTEAKTDRQARNRAFAAEFLAPSEGLRVKVSSTTVTGDEVDELASEFGVSPWVIAHQLDNHDIARVAVDQPIGGTESWGESRRSA